MNFEYLNKMIDYIEKNLDKEIDFQILSKIANTNIFILERIFSFLTNMTITEYIKKRRLSKAFEEIRNTNLKIIDIAFKYQYNSAQSFSRSFKGLFNITPTECRKGVGNYKMIPIEYFEVHKSKYSFDYEIKRMKNIYLYCYHITSENHTDLLYKIKQLYNQAKLNGYYREFSDNGMYGIFLKIKGSYHYYLGSTKYNSNLEKYELKESEYAVFQLSSRKQNDIVSLEKQIHTRWVPSTDYNVNDNIVIERYNDSYTYIYLPLK